MKRKKKWIYLFLIIVLVVPVLFLYQSFNGNPISKWMAGKTLKTYLSKEYPKEEFRVSDGFFNFKSGGYSYDVTKIGRDGGDAHEFEVTGLFKPSVSYDGIYYDRLDEKLIEKLQQEANEELATLLTGNGLKILEIGTMIEVLEGTYPPDTKWRKDLKLEKPFNLFIILDADGMDKKDMLASAEKIRSILNSEHYAYDRISLNGNLLDPSMQESFETGYVRFSVAFDKGEKIDTKDIEEIKQ